jgi:hypothetical protein
MIQFGGALAGVVLVNVNPANRSRELSFVSGKVQEFKMREFEISVRGLEAVANRQTA